MNRHLQDKTSHRSIYFIPVREYVYLFHFSSLSTVLTGGIFVTATKTQKEIQSIDERTTVLVRLPGTASIVLYCLS